MFKLILVATCVLASAQAGVIHAGLPTTYAAGPLLGAPLLGKVTYNAPQTTVVKQPVVVDQNEYHYRAVPQFVDTAPIVKTVVQPVVQQYAAAPAALTYAAPFHGFSYGYAAPALSLLK